MDNFCTSELWNTNLTWNTDIPLFTSCFLKTAVLWTPIAFFWLFIPIEVIYVIRSKESKLPWSFLNIAKLVILFLLILSTITEIVYYMTDIFSSSETRIVQSFTPLLMLVTLIVTFIVMLLHRQKGIATSGILFLFWLLLTVAFGLNYYTVFQITFNDHVTYDPLINQFEFIISVVNFPLAFIQFFLYCYADRRYKTSEIDPKECPILRASFLSQVTFWWFNPMAILGYRKPLTIEDMWKLSNNNTAETLTNRFNKYWLPLVALYFGEIRKIKNKIARRFSRAASVQPTVAIQSDSVDAPKKSLSILFPLIKTFWLELLLTGLLKFVASLITFANPIVLDALIAFVSSNDPYWKGFVFAGGMFFIGMLESFFNSQYEFRIYCIAMQIRSSVTSVLYKKALTLSTSVKKNFTTGEIVNLMSVDIQRIVDYVQVVNLLWSAPLQIGVALYLLWQQLGVATMGGLAVMILMIPLNMIVTIYIRKSQVIIF